VANRFRGELYRWHVLSADGGAVLASNGMSVNADAALEPLKKARPCWWWPASNR
jgi:AraC family carnitine catabolism transcriptional activator